MHYGYYGFDGDGFNGFHSYENSTYKQTLPRSHRLLTWTPANSDSWYATGILEFRVHLVGERENAMGHGLKLCHLPSPPSTPRDNNTTSHESTMLRADKKLDTALNDHVTLPAPPTSSQSDSAWQDETYDVNMAQICATLRARGAVPQELIRNDKWFAEAVAVDALFPPGIPLSLGEICVYYPHHVRWQDVMFRLVQNDYCGQDILGTQDHMSPSIMNQIQRDAMKKRSPAFKTTGYEGKGDPDLHTNGLRPGTYLDDRLQGFTLPSFGDLLRGLDFLPAGPDARQLTQCLTWYLRIRDTFQPRLELNVLHTQALVRALRQPLRPVGSQNLNRHALKRWRKEVICDKIDIKDLALGEESAERMEVHTAKSAGERAVIDRRNNSVVVEVRIPLRNILTFPFLALHGVVGKAFEMGIDKTQRKMAAREGMVTPTRQLTPAKSASATATNITSSLKPSPKRLRPSKSDKLSTPAQTPKRQRKADDGLEVWHPRQPTVSPITPRAAPPQPALTIPKNLLANLEFGLRKRGPAQQKP